MFESLTERLNLTFKKLKGQGKLSEANMKEGLREVRMALLEADVHYKVAKDFIERVRERALGQEVLASLTPAQQVIKIVQEEMTELMGGVRQDLNLGGRAPIALMLVGLQGSGKTTSAGKLALYLKEKNFRPGLVPADVYRPAAIDQLHKVGQMAGVEVYPSDAKSNPVDLCTKALDWGRLQGLNPLILDTAGRLHIDEGLMTELKNIKDRVRPNEILLVADAMTGQDAINVAQKFNELLDLSGVILTKMEGDARGGAALSIKGVIQKPIKFIGVGEKLESLEAFHPERMASRILGMGDVLSLIEKAQLHFDQKQALDLEKKIRKETFTLDDFKEQLRQIKKMGSLEQMIQMIPGINKIKGLKDAQPDEKELVRVEAIINSMTPEERKSYQIINGSRRRRIAKGSGTTVSEVNKMLKSFEQMQKMLKQFNKGGRKALKRGYLPF
ncbi:MAG TPA: signal recognition particle protein [Thermodesulfobacteriota bacterium]|nr:signal recognition particle protein [Thermodesulfobacteriota bacterium]